jgi:deoxycytidine triphosphate deaminase
MIISAKRVLELNKKYKLIDNLSARELCPEGVGIDVRVGEVYKIKGEGYLGSIKRKTPSVEKTADIKQNDKKITLNPGDFVLIKTIETVNVPANKIVIEEGKEPAYIMLDVYPRSTLQRCGIYFLGTKTDPGYFGELTFGLANVGGVPFILDLGARVANLVFKQVLGDICKAYEGQWKGGRVGTQESEEQK